MKKYRVTVNGTVYEVELEELTTAPAAAPAADNAGPAITSPMGVRSTVRRARAPHPSLKSATRSRRVR